MMGKIFSKPVTREVIETPVPEPGLLTRDVLKAAIDKLQDARISRFSKHKYVYRTLRHAISWARNYVVTEAEELDADFVSEKKGYHIVMLSEPNGGSLSIVFRLTTAGLDGWTEYGIRLLKAGSFYACLE